MRLPWWKENAIKNWQSCLGISSDLRAAVLRQVTINEQHFKRNIKPIAEIAPPPPGPGNFITPSCGGISVKSPSYNFRIVRHKQNDIGVQMVSTPGS